MPRKPLHILALCIFLAAASGAALSAHEHLAGPNHHADSCSICQDLLAGTKVIAPVATSVALAVPVVAIVALPASQEPARLLLPTAIAPRAPPVA